MQKKLLASLLVITATGADIASARPPIVYSQPSYQSPVQAAPNDLLLLPGTDFSASDTVVYVKQIEGLAAAPDVVPDESNALVGIAPIVSSRGIPNSLTVRMPGVMEPGETYALWVRNSAGEWSNAALINDPRPLWITPSTIPSRGTIANLPRQIKVVGRNLQLLPSQNVKMRLLGPQIVELDATQSQAVNEYFVTVSLPEELEPGDYVVQFRRGQEAWLNVPEQILKVTTPPEESLVFDIGSPLYGACYPDDSLDDTSCLLSALAAARSANGGTVVLGSGLWDLGDSANPRAATDKETIVIPRGVRLRGQSATTTRLTRHIAHGTNAAPAFILMGDNVVSGVTFAESRAYQTGEAPAPMLQLGPTWTPAAGPAAPIENIVITGNVLDRPGHAISDGGAPLRAVYITNNVIGAYHVGVRLSGNRFNVTQRFRVDDSVIAYNTFLPGSYLDIAAGQGAIASEIGASSRLDFSNNVADGASVDALYPGAAAGWRAGFFWHMNDNHEQVLVANNIASCTGDKSGDGEAIAYDNNANTYAFSGGVSVLAATATSITLAGIPKNRQNFRAIDPAQFYAGHWIRILQGVGIGQVRRITAYEIDAQNGQVRFDVAPAWDVPPTNASASVAREIWQVYTVDNVVDHRAPLCRKSNRNRQRGGAIALWGEMTDAVVSGNRQYDTDGIVLNQTYRPDAAGCTDCNGAVNAKSFIEVRDNLIEGEYDWTSDCSWSGIQAQYGAALEAPPTTVTFGVSIAHNEIARADGWRGGAISMPLTWHAGPPPSRWMLIDSTLIHHNLIRDVTGTAARKICDRATAWDRVGLKLAGSDLVWRTVTHHNVCINTPASYRAGGNETVNDCSLAPPDSCECAAAR